MLSPSALLRPCTGAFCGSLVWFAALVPRYDSPSSRSCPYSVLLRPLLAHLPGVFALMAIHGITGLPGCGKTLFLVHLLRRMKGRRRMSNLFPRSGEWEFALWPEMRTAGHAVVGIDEAHMWFASRNWSKTDQAELAVFQQHRKQGIDLYYTVQNLSRVDVAVRELTAYMHLVKRFGNLIIDTVYFPEELNKPNPKPFRRRPYYITPADYRSYYTEQIIGDKDGNGYDLGQLAKPPSGYNYYLSKDRLSGEELRYIEPDIVVVRGLSQTIRVPWRGDVNDVLDVLETWEKMGEYVGFANSITFELFVSGRWVRWSMQHYYDAGHPIPHRIRASWNERRNPFPPAPGMASEHEPEAKPGRAQTAGRAPSRGPRNTTPTLN